MAKKKTTQPEEVNLMSAMEQLPDNYIEHDADGTEIVTSKKSWVRNPRPVTMSIKDDDPERNKLKADLFNRLYELKNRQGIAKFESVEEMELVIDNYFYNCADLRLRPTIRGLASALGTVYRTLEGWEAGERDGTLGPNCSRVIKKAKQFIAEFDEQAAVEGIDNPILFMFRAKNYYGMSDKQEMEITAKNDNIKSRTAAEIQNKLLEDNQKDDIEADF